MTDERGGGSIIHPSIRARWDAEDAALLRGEQFVGEMVRLQREAAEHARAVLAARIEARVRDMPHGWTRPDDQFGPKQYEWVYVEAVLAAIREEAAKGS